MFLNLLQFNLDNLIQTAADLSSLVIPFSQQKIDSMVRALPSDKAPGLDGFNIDFVQKCWSVICEDF